MVLEAVLAVLPSVLVKDVPGGVAAGNAGVAGLFLVWLGLINGGALEVVLVLEVLPKDYTVVVPAGIFVTVVGTSNSEIVTGVGGLGLEVMELEETDCLATFFEVFGTLFGRNTPTPQSTPSNNKARPKNPINRQIHLGHLSLIGRAAGTL